MMTVADLLFQIKSYMNEKMNENEWKTNFKHL